MNFENMLEKHTFTLPSSKKKLFLRPILVKEEKILLIHKGNNNKDFLNAILQVIENCTINKDEIQWKNMSYNDFTYAFVKLREISRDDIVSISVNCENKTCENHENNIIKNFNIKDILKIKNENNKYSNILKINDTYSIQLREMSLNFILSLYEEYTEEEIKKENPFIININMIIEHTDAVITEKEKITDKNDIKEFIEHLKMKDIVKIYKWFSNEPQIEVITHWVCDKCKTNNVFEEVDVINFFDIY